MNSENQISTLGQAVPGFFPLAEVESIEMAPGVSLQLVCGDKAMMSFVTLQPGSVVPLHSHPHEQMGTGLEGEMLLFIGGMEDKYSRIIRAGDTYVIPGGVPHAAKAVGDVPAVALDVFSPPREDYLEKFREIYNKPTAGLAQV